MGAGGDGAGPVAGATGAGAAAGEVRVGIDTAPAPQAAVSTRGPVPADPTAVTVDPSPLVATPISSSAFGAVASAEATALQDVPSKCTIRVLVRPSAEL